MIHREQTIYIAQACQRVHTFSKDHKAFSQIPPKDTNTLLLQIQICSEIVTNSSQDIPKHLLVLSFEMLLRVSLPGSTQAPGIWGDLSKKNDSRFHLSYFETMLFPVPSLSWLGHFRDSTETVMHCVSN